MRNVRDCSGMKVLEVTSAKPQAQYDDIWRTVRKLTKRHTVMSVHISADESGDLLAEVVCA